MDSWGWAIVLAAVAAVTAMLLMALYDEISRRRWIAKSGAERRSTSHSLREAEACRGSSAAPAAPALVSPVRTDPPPVTRPPPKGVGAVGEFAGDVAVRARAREAIRPSTLEVPDDTQVSPASAAVLVGVARQSDGDAAAMAAAAAAMAVAMRTGRGRSRSRSRDERAVLQSNGQTALSWACVSRLERAA